MLPGIELTNGIIGNLAGGVPLVTKDGAIVGSIGGWQTTFYSLSFQVPSSMCRYLRCYDSRDR